MIDGQLTLFAALLAGLAGSGHCVAMCGGMASLLATRQHKQRPVRMALAYNVGRVTTYVIAGTLVGALGKLFVFSSGIDGVIANLRLVTAALIIIAGLVLFGGNRLFRIFEGIGGIFWKRISPLAVRNLRNAHNSHFSIFLLGMLWGWLPCGMTYAMLSTAAFTADPLHAAALMAAFGIGTLPSMLGTGLAGMRVRAWLGNGNTRRIAGIAMIIIGVWTAQPQHWFYSDSDSDSNDHSRHETLQH